jgi:hypothetical protein
LLCFILFLSQSRKVLIFIFLDGHFEICRLGAVEEIPQKNILFPEFLRLLRQISMGLDFLVPFLSRKKEPAGGRINSPA